MWNKEKLHICDSSDEKNHWLNRFRLFHKCRLLCILNNRVFVLLHTVCRAKTDIFPWFLTLLLMQHTLFPLKLCRTHLKALNYLPQLVSLKTLSVVLMVKIGIGKQGEADLLFSHTLACWLHHPLQPDCGIKRSNRINFSVPCPSHYLAFARPGLVGTWEVSCVRQTGGTSAHISLNVWREATIRWRSWSPCCTTVYSMTGGLNRKPSHASNILSNTDICCRHTESSRVKTLSDWINTDV